MNNKPKDTNMSIFPDTKGLALWYKLRAWLYWFRAWLHPHNVLILDIPPNWCDKDELIRLAVFKYLVKFVEEEEPLNHINWDSDEQHKEAMSSIIKAYKWITVERPAAVAEYERLLHVTFGRWKLTELDKVSREDAQRVTDAEMYFEDKDQEILHLIIDIRGMLWT